MTQSRGQKARASRWCAAVVAAALVVGVQVAGAAPVPGGTVTVGITSDPITLDPHASAYANTYLVGSLNLIESLVYQQPDGKIVPWLASSYRVSPDGRTFTFVLRQDVRFSDGAPFDANAVKWNFDRIVNPNFRPGGSITALVGYTGTTVVDDHTVQIHFKDPYAPFLSYAAGGLLGILSPKTTAHADARGHARRAPVGSGPFMVSEYVTNDHVTIVRNAAYNRREPWSDHQGPAYLDRVVWKIVPESETRAITLSSGETQMIYVLGYGTAGGSILAQLRKDARLVMDTRPFPGSAYLWLINVRRPPRPTTCGCARRSCTASTAGRSSPPIYRGPRLPRRAATSATCCCRTRRPAPTIRTTPARPAQLLDEAGWKMGPNHVRVEGRPSRSTW